jgi:glycosyltransferase involved in cell wall biosynthesis
LNRSLSVLLPVHNVQATLQADVGRMLDVLPELTGDFDLLIIDDGSTDATSEVAHELATQFPQVRFHRHSRRRGVEAALRDGLAQTKSPVVLAHNGQSQIDPAEVMRVWTRERSEAETLRIPRANRSHHSLAGDVGAVSGKLASERDGFRILRRDPAMSFGPFRGISRIEPRSDARASKPARGGNASRRPNFLSRLKDFALGE